MVIDIHRAVGGRGDGRRDGGVGYPEESDGAGSRKTEGSRGDHFVVAGITDLGTGDVENIGVAIWIGHTVAVLEPGVGHGRQYLAIGDADKVHRVTCKVCAGGRRPDDDGCDRIGGPNIRGGLVKSSCDNQVADVAEEVSEARSLAEGIAPRGCWGSNRVSGETAVRVG